MSHCAEKRPAVRCWAPSQDDRTDRRWAAHRVQNHAAGSRAVHRAVTRPGESFGGAGRPTAPLFPRARVSQRNPFLSGQCSGNPLKLSYGLEPYSTVLSWYQPDDSTYENSPEDSRGAIIRTPWPESHLCIKQSLFFTLGNLEGLPNKSTYQDGHNPAGGERGQDVALIVQVRAGRGSRVLHWRASAARW